MKDIKINDKNEGLYYLEEHLSKEFLEKTNRAGVDVIKGNDDMGHQYSSTHWTPFQGLLSGIDIKNFSGLNLDQMNKYRELMTVKNYQDLIELINVDDFAKYQAISSIMFDYGHSSSRDNLRLLYNTSNGKFSPYIRIESKIENMYSSNAQTIDEGLVFSDNIFEALFTVDCTNISGSIEYE